MYVCLHLAISTFSFQAHVKYTEIDGVLGNKASFSKLQKIGAIQKASCSLANYRSVIKDE